MLVAVVLYAVRDIAGRRARNDWKRTLSVALVVVQEGAVSPEAVARVRERTRTLRARLDAEFARYRGQSMAPFSFDTYGAVSLRTPVPHAPAGGVFGAAAYAWELYRFTSDVDGRAGVPTRAYDSRVYLVVRAPSSRGFVEGMSQEGGTVGIAIAELDETTVDLALFVAAHELFHTLGATDSYGADGRTLIPDGLASPAQEPLYPQRHIEIMSRNRPISAHAEVPLESLDELAVGARTAREIGWTSPLRP